MTNEPIDVVKVLVLPEEDPKPKHAGGRPSDYSASVLDEFDDYMTERQDEKYEFHKTRGEKSDSYEQRVNVKLPTRDGFAKRLGITRQTLDNWSNAHPELFDALSFLDTEQKERLIEEGLAGNYNPVIAKLLLSANHGMREKGDIELSGKDGGAIPQHIAISFV